MKIFDDILNDIWLEFYKYKDKTYINKNNEKKNYIVKNSIPILFFGNYKKYFASDTRIITVAKNPSDIEFPKSIKRFETDLTLLKDKKKYLKTISEYFQKEPYTKWFNHFEKLINNDYLNGSYFDNNNRNYVLHTDLCSIFATEEKWDDIPKTQKIELSSFGKVIWSQLIDLLEPQIIILSAAAYTKSMTNHNVEWKKINLPNDFKKSFKLEMSEYQNKSYFWIKSGFFPVVCEHKTKEKLAMIINKNCQTPKTSSGIDC